MAMGLARFWAALALALAAAVFAAPAPAADRPDAQLAALVERLQGVQIHDGEQVVIALQPDGAMKLVSRATAPAGAPPPPPAADPKVETIVPAPMGAASAAPDTFAASFRTFGARGAVLGLENGFSHPIIYDAAIVVRRGTGFAAAPTSICPVPGKRRAAETWGPPVIGLILWNPRRPPGDDLHCSGGSGLLAAMPAERNYCMGGARGGPVQVQLAVDPATGARLGAEAMWMLRGPATDQPVPMVVLSFPMQGAAVGGMPDGAVVVAIAPLNPPPKAKSASIVLIADGVEAARRPWRMYAQRAAADPSAPKGAQPVAFVGTVPFPLRRQDGSADPELEPLFRAVGAGTVKRLEVKVEGDDGSTISDATFSLGPPAVGDAGLIASALKEAEAKSAEPGHCARAPGG